MSKPFEKVFSDSTDHAIYTVVLASENGQERTFTKLDHQNAKLLYEWLRALAEEDV